jgi:hypothetical protein
MKKECAGQPDPGPFFDIGAPAAADEGDGVLSIANKIAGVMNKAIEGCGIPCGEATERMGRLFGLQSISKHILNALPRPRAN